MADTESQEVADGTEEKPEGYAQQPPGSMRLERGVPGLDFTAGLVMQDPKVDLQGLRGVEQFDLMRYEDPTVAAVLLALSLPVRAAKWRVNPASDTGPDIEAADFVESCLHDMSMSWDDVLAEACTMYAFGWSWMEWCLKRRMGPNPRGSNVSPSKYSDGRVGFRKIALRAQTSLYDWDMDEETGGIRAMNQIHPYTQKLLSIPLSKSLLFRTTREANNPEGMSVLRPAWRSWKFKREIERIEAIGLQRALAGMPVTTLPSGYTTIEGQGTSSEEYRAEKIIKGVAQNTMLGIIETDRLTFRFETPDMQGITGDSTRVITRYDEAIVRSTLAMYILLGSRERGSYALAKELGDLFFMAVGGYINLISEVISSWAIPVLFRYNVFPGITGYPQIATAINRRLDLETLGEFINKTVGQMVITPDDELESHIRQMADFPPKMLSVSSDRKRPEDIESEAGPPAGTEQQEQGSEPVGEFIGDVEAFRAMAGGPLSAYQAAANAYRDELRNTYSEWIDATFEEIAEAETLEQGRDTWKLALAALLLLVRRRAWARFPEAMALGYRQAGLPPGLRAVLDEELLANDQFMEQLLIPAVERQLAVEQLNDMILLLQAGRGLEAREMWHGIMAAREWHAGMYSGHFYRVIWLGAIEWLRESEIEVDAVSWDQDALAKHCADCAIFGGRKYANMEDLLAATRGILPGQGTACSSNCRCWLSYRLEEMWHIL